MTLRLHEQHEQSTRSVLKRSSFSLTFTLNKSYFPSISPKLTQFVEFSSNVH